MSRQPTRIPPTDAATTITMIFCNEEDDCFSVGVIGCAVVVTGVPSVETEPIVTVVFASSPVVPVIGVSPVVLPVVPEGMTSVGKYPMGKKPVVTVSVVFHIQRSFKVPAEC